MRFISYEPSWKVNRCSYRLQPEDVAHRVQAGLLRNDPERRAERPAGEAFAALRPMRELEPLAGAEEVDGVVADRVAAAQRDDADLGVGARTGLALAAEARASAQRRALRGCDDLGEPQRRAARG